MEKEKTIIEKLFDNKIFLAMLIVALCGPYMLTRGIASIKVLYEFITAVASWLVIFLYVKYGKITVPAKWMFLFIGWTFVTTFFLSRNTMSFYQLFLPITAMALLIELAFQYKGYNLLDVTSIFRIYIYINFFMVVFFPEGVLENSSWWFLGYRNIQSWTLLPVATLLIIRALWKFGKLDRWTYSDLTVIFLTLILIKSATSWIGTFVYLVVAGIAWICYKKHKMMPKIINLFDGLLITGVFFVGIILCKLQFVFEPIIVNVLHKDITFTGRTVIWDMTVEYVKEHWLTGAGYLTITDFRNLFPDNVYSYAHPHNYVLSLMVQGGIILLAIAILGIVLSGMRLWKCRGRIVANLFLALLLSMQIMGLTEALSVYLCPLMYPMLTLSMHIEKIDKIVWKKEKSFGDKQRS